MSRRFGDEYPLPPTKSEGTLQCLDSLAASAEEDTRLAYALACNPPTRPLLSTESRSHHQGQRETIYDACWRRWKNAEIASDSIRAKFDLASLVREIRQAEVSRTDYPNTMSDFVMEDGLNSFLRNKELSSVLVAVGFGEKERKTALKRLPEARKRCKPAFKIAGESMDSKE